MSSTLLKAFEEKDMQKVFEEIGKEILINNKQLKEIKEEK